MDESTTPRRPSRRAVAKGAAWTVPAIAVVSPTPAMAASPGIVTLTGENCKLPGDSSAPYTNGAVYLATISNTTLDPIEIEIISFTRGEDIQTGSQVGVVKLTASPAGDCCTNLVADTVDTFTVPANSSGTYALVTQDWLNNANTNLVVEYEVDGLAQPLATGDENSLNPMGVNTPCSQQTGSCDVISEAEQLCILTAVAVPNCDSTDCL